MRRPPPSPWIFYEKKSPCVVPWYFHDNIVGVLLLGHVCVVLPIVVAICVPMALPIKKHNCHFSCRARMYCPPYRPRITLGNSHRMYIRPTCLCHSDCRVRVSQACHAHCGQVADTLRICCVSCQLHLTVVWEHRLGGRRPHLRSLRINIVPFCRACTRLPPCSPWISYGHSRHM